MTRYRNSGFSLLELALVTIIAGILITLFLNRALGLMMDVERVNLLQWESKIKTALSHEMSRVVIAGDFAKIERLEAINPMRLLREVPRSYLGEKTHPDLAKLPEGSWIFDTSRKVLVYTIDNSDRFTSDLSGRPRAEYQVQLDYQDNNLNHRFDFKLDTLRSLQLVTLGQYQWLSDVDG